MSGDDKEGAILYCRSTGYSVYRVGGRSQNDAVERAYNTYRLEDIDQTHRLGAALFIPFTILRLRGDSETTEATLTVALRNIGDTAETQHTLHLSWLPESIPRQPPGVPERVITEWAACGIACVVVAFYAGLTIREVAADGDRFDYWVDDGLYEYGLEVSGTMGEDLAARQRAKVRQLCDNPYGVDGYVVVVSFATRHIILSFHRCQEESR